MPGRQSQTIVIADADEEVRLNLREAAAQADPDARIYEVSDGLELREALRQYPVDMAFIDVGLPQTSGADIIAWRQAGDGQRLVVLISDLLAPSWPQIAKKIGAYDVLLKPVSDVHIRRVVEASLILRRRLNVLIVDPSRETRTVIKRLMGRSQFRLDTQEAETGRAALQLLRRSPFDLAVVAMEIPDDSALEVACRIENLRPETKIALSARSLEPGMAKQLETFGICTFLRKPFGFAEIDSMLHEVFGLWRPYLITALRAEERSVLGIQDEDAANLQAGVA